MFNSIGVKKFCKTETPKGIADLRATAVSIFQALSTNISNNGFSPDLCQFAATYFNADALHIEEFRLLFQDTRLYTAIKTAPVYDAFRPYFSSFHACLSPEQMACLSDEWKSLVKQEAASTISVESFQAVLTVMVEDNQHGDAGYRLLPHHLYEVKKENLTNWQEFFQKETIEKWIKHDEKNIKIQKIRLLFELQYLLLHHDDFKSTNVPNDFHLEDESLRIDAAIHIILDAASRWEDEVTHQLGSELTNHLMTVFSYLPKTLYPHIFSNPLFSYWKTEVNPAPAQLLGRLFHQLDQREGKGLEEKRLIANAFMPKEQSSARVITEYWACEPKSVALQFPSISAREFLENIKERSIEKNLRYFLRVLHDLTIQSERSAENTRVADLFSSFSQQGQQRIRNIEQLFNDPAFDISYIIESPAVLHMISPTMWYMFNNTLGASLTASRSTFSHYEESYAQTQNRYIDAFFNQMSELLNSETLQQSFEDEANEDDDDLERNDAYYDVRYWYDDSDIQQVIQYESQHRGFVGPNQQHIDFLSAYSYEDLHGFKIHLQSAFERLAEKMTSQQPFTVAIPIYRLNHWVGCVLNVNQEQKQVSFHFIDPKMLHTNGDTLMVSSLQSLLTRTFQENAQFGKGYQFKAATPLQIIKQHDNCSCGPILIENMMNIVYNTKSVSREQNGSKITRAKHVQLLGPEFSRKQRADRLYLLINRLPSLLKDEYKKRFKALFEKAPPHELKNSVIELLTRGFSSQNAPETAHKILKKIFQELLKGVTCQMSTESLLLHIVTAEFGVGSEEVLQKARALIIKNSSTPLAETSGETKALDKKISDLNQALQDLYPNCKQDFISDFQNILSRDNINSPEKRREALNSALLSCYYIASALVQSIDETANVSIDELIQPILNIFFSQRNDAVCRAPIEEFLGSTEPDKEFMQLIDGISNEAKFGVRSEEVLQNANALIINNSSTPPGGSSAESSVDLRSQDPENKPKDALVRHGLFAKTSSETTTFDKKISDLSLALEGLYPGCKQYFMNDFQSILSQNNIDPPEKRREALNFALMTSFDVASACNMSSTKDSINKRIQSILDIFFSQRNDASRKAPIEKFLLSTEPDKEFMQLIDGMRNQDAKSLQNLSS